MPDEKKTSRFIFSAPPSLLARIDRWRAQQPGVPTRAEAVRQLLTNALNFPQYDSAEKK
jgi:hypothetical protein